MTDNLIDDSRLTRTREWLATCRKTVVGRESGCVRSAGAKPIVVQRGEGARFYDVDGNGYIDWCLGDGSMIFGHRPKPILDSIVAQITQGGMLYAFPHELELEVGRKIAQAVPGVEQVCFAGSGSEATQAAMRLARAYTGKDKVLKWEGAYHGLLDCHAFSSLPALGAAGTERYPRTLPAGAGIPRAVEETVIVGCFNDLEGVDKLLRRNADQLAAVLCEPVLASSGVIAPEPGFLEGLRRICDECGVLLIFDEVSTGFRVALGGAQELYGITPDLTCLGKAVGGGTPGAAAFGGRKDIMSLAGDGSVLHGGTYAGNPLTLAGMNATLDILVNDRQRVYGHLTSIANAMVEGMRVIFAEQGVPAYVSQVGPMWQVFFGQSSPVTRHRRARASDARFFARVQAECQARGAFFPPSNAEPFFASTAHTKTEVDQSLEAIATAATLAKEACA